MHSAKRKRANTAAIALTKPFRSPMHVDPTKKNPSSGKEDDQISQGPSKTTTPTKQSPFNQHCFSSPTTRLSQASPIHQRSHQSLSSPIRSTPSGILGHDPEYTVLQKKHSALLLQLKELSASLDKASQALKAAQSDNDSGLYRLVTKWRTASRDAAEELFTTAKDRVNRMGGVEVWRDKYMTPKQEGSWNTEPEIDEDDLSEEQREQLDDAREEARIEAEKYGLYQEQPKTEIRDDDSFTIELMLKQLNVDLQAIGYDCEAQRWTEH